MFKYFSLVLFISHIWTQQIPHGVPMYKNLKPNSVFEIKLDIPSKIPPNIIGQIKPVQYLGDHYYYFRVRLDKVMSVSFQIIESKFSENMELFFINESINGYVGPYNKKSLRILIKVFLDKSNQIPFSLKFLFL